MKSTLLADNKVVVRLLLRIDKGQCTFTVTKIRPRIYIAKNKYNNMRFLTPSICKEASSDNVYIILFVLSFFVEFRCWVFRLLLPE